MPEISWANALAAAPLPFTQVRVTSEQYPAKQAPASTSSDCAGCARFE